MKCKQHPNERGPGVCASCLSDRLFALIAIQNGLSGDFHHQRQRSAGHHLPPPLPPPPVIFPRSVSPYVAGRRSLGSDGPDLFRHGRFFSTPHIGPSFDAGGGGDHSGGRRRSSVGRSSVLSILFRHRRSGESEADHGNSRSVESPGSGFSWLSALIPARWKKEMKPFREDKAAAAAAVVVDRGMSPAVEDDFEDYSISSSGYSTESSSAAGWRQPAPTPMRRFPASHRHRRRHHQNGGNVSGFAFCRSPMMRPGPGGGGRRGRPPPPEAAIPGEPRGFTDRQVPTSLRQNRSRKLADLGRFR